MPAEKRDHAADAHSRASDLPAVRAAGARVAFSVAARGGGTGGPKLPSGVTRAQYEAAIKKCGGGAFAGGATARLKNPAFLAALTKFAACMRENGVNVPAPNTSGNGPVFDTKGIDTSSSQFRAAESKCRSDLTSAFHRGSGADRPPSGGSTTG